MSAEQIQVRLEALQKGTHELQELIDRLFSLKFAPGSIPLNVSDEDSVSGELSAEISQLIRDEEDELEVLKEEIEDLPTGKKQRPQEGFALLFKELANCRTTFREAQIAARKNIAIAQRLERQLLINAYIQPETMASESDPSEAVTTHRKASFSLTQKQSTFTEDEQKTVGASSTYTMALRQAHEMISTELSRSQYAHEALAESSAALAQLTESYGSLEGMLKSSKDLLGTLVSSQKSDTWYLQTSLAILLGTLGWLVFRRIFYGPTWWLVYLPLRLVFGVGWTVTKAVIPSGQRIVDTPEVSILPVAEVSGLPDESLPTVSVDGVKIETVKAENEAPTLNQEEETLSEQVGKIIDGEPSEVEPKPDESTIDKSTIPEIEVIIEEQPIEDIVVDPSKEQTEQRFADHEKDEL